MEKKNVVGSTDIMVWWETNFSFSLVEALNCCSQENASYYKVK